MGTATLALMIYVAIIIIWATVVKKNMAEGMILGFLVVGMFGGKNAFSIH